MVNHSADNMRNISAVRLSMEHAYDSEMFSHDFESYLEQQICANEEMLVECVDSFGFDERNLENSKFLRNHVSCRCTVSAKQIVADYENNAKYMELIRDIKQGDIDMNERDTISQTPLHLAVQYSHYEMVEHLLRHGATPDAQDFEGRTPLHWAAHVGDVRTAELLLQYSASLHSRTHRGHNPLYLAVRSGCIVLVRMFIERGFDVNEIIDDLVQKRQFTHLHNAVESNNVMMVDILLQCRADVNQRDSHGHTCLHSACNSGHLEIAELLLKYGADLHVRDYNNKTPVHFAIERGHKDVFRLLLDHGADLNGTSFNGGSLLHSAIRQGDFDMFKTLLDRGAQVNAVNQFGKTPLHDAIIEKNLVAIKMLLEHGADVNSKDVYGKTSLHMAVECRRKDLIEFLLENDADVNVGNNDMQTPLHSAVKQGCYATVEMLLQHGADVNAKDAIDQTPLHLAVRFGQINMFDLMVAHGADLNAADADGKTPMHTAVISEYSKLVYLPAQCTFFANLLTHKVKLNARTLSSGETPLHLAVRKGCTIFAKYLLMNGAEVDATALGGRTALHVAVEESDYELVQLLLTYGADMNKADEQGCVAFRPKLHKHVHTVFVRHLIRMRVAGFPIKPEQLQIVTQNADEESQKFREECEKQIENMKNTRLDDEVTVYNFLRGTRTSLVNYLKKKEVTAMFGQYGQFNHKSEFPYYADVMEKNYGIGQLYSQILEPTIEKFNAVTGYALPSVPMYEIISYFNSEDMRNFLMAV